MRVVMLVGLLLVAGAACKKRSPVGQSCEGSDGCVDGADCLLGYTAVVPPVGQSLGTCVQRCTQPAASSRAVTRAVAHRA